MMCARRWHMLPITMQLKLLHLILQDFLGKCPVYCLETFFFFLFKSKNSAVDPLSQWFFFSFLFSCITIGEHE